MVAVDYHDLRVEHWKRIPRWPAYEVSTWGNVKSYWKTASFGGSGFHWVVAAEGKLLVQELNRGGYPRVWLCDGSGVRERRLVAHLVLETFVGLCPPGMEVCHFPDPTRTNSRLDNLRWDTRSENAIDRVLSGNFRAAKLTRPEVEEVWRRLVAGDKCNEIARDFNLNSATVSHIAKGRIWSHITKDLPGRPRSRRLTESEIQSIWQRLVRGDKLVDIARDYDVCVATISHVKSGKCFGEITSKLPGAAPPVRQQRRLTPELKAEIRKALADGVRWTTVLERYNLSTATLWRLKKSLP